MIYQPGDILLDKYRIEALIGQGAFGDVYHVTQLKQAHAIKVLRRDMGGISTEAFRKTAERFRFEAQLGAHLNHPNIIKVHDFEESGGELYLVMEYASGGSLEEKFKKKGPLSIADTLRLGTELCTGLEFLHNNIYAVHRDIKPANILFDADGTAKIADLGLAQVEDTSRRSLLGSLAGTHPGTPLYMSPEQEVTAAYLLPTSDIFAIGCVLFEALTGKPYKSVYGTRARTLRRSVPVWLDEIVAQALAEDPGRVPDDDANPKKRYREARLMRTALISKGIPVVKNTLPATPAGSVPNKKRVSRFGLLAVLVLCSGLLAVLAIGNPQFFAQQFGVGSVQPTVFVLPSQAPIPTDPVQPLTVLTVNTPSPTLTPLESTSLTPETLQPTITPSFTSAPPTAVLPTSTSIPPTAVLPTSTSIPPTAVLPTSTPIPPTAVLPTFTPIPPTAVPPTQPAVPGPNLLGNGGFENGTAGAFLNWTFSPSNSSCSRAQHEYIWPFSRTGARFLSAGRSPDYPNCFSVWQEVNVAPQVGQTYTAGFWLRNGGNNEVSPKSQNAVIALWALRGELLRMWAVQSQLPICSGPATNSGLPQPRLATQS